MQGRRGLHDPEDPAGAGSGSDDPTGKSRQRRPHVALLASLHAHRHAIGLIVLQCIAAAVSIAALVKLARPLFQAGENEWQAASRWAIPADAPAVQRDAQLEQQAFCRDLFARRPGPPKTLRIGWTEDGTGQLAARDDPADGANALGLDALKGVVILDRIDNIEPLFAHNERYSLYVFGGSYQSQDIVSASIRRNKEWESLEAYTHVGYLDNLARELHLPRHEIYFIDIGANVGAFAFAVAQAGFSVIAVEAMHVCQYALRLSLCAAPDVAPNMTLLPVALGREAARCALYTGDENVLDGHVRCGDDGQASREDARLVRRQSVDVVRLDDLLADWMPRLKGRVGALKMDTEGFEPWVVEGAQEFFRTVKPRFAQVEVSQMADKATGVPARALLRQLAGLGFELRLGPHGRAVAADDVDIPPESNPINIYLVPAEAK